MDAALDFAAEYLAPHAATDAAFLAEVEQALALLVFATPADAPPPLSELLAPAQRATAAGELNAAMPARAKKAVRLRVHARMRCQVLMRSPRRAAAAAAAQAASTRANTGALDAAGLPHISAECAELCPSPFQLAESTTFPSIVDVSTGVLESAHAAEGLD